MLQPMFVQAMWTHCTFKFGMVTLENTLQVVQERVLWMFFVPKCLFHITNQLAHFAVHSRLGFFSQPRGNTAGFSECS